MPTLVQIRTVSRRERTRRDLTPALVVIALSLLFALAFCAAFAPRPMPDATVAALQGGL